MFELVQWSKVKRRGGAVKFGRGRSFCGLGRAQQLASMENNWSTVFFQSGTDSRGKTPRVLQNSSSADTLGDEGPLLLTMCAVTSLAISGPQKESNMRYGAEQ